MIKKLSRFTVIAAVLLCAFLSAAGVAAAKTIEEIAWQRAMKLAKVTKAEAARWKRPEVVITPYRRYIPTGPDDGYRICGEMRSALIGDRPNLVWEVKVYVYARPDETALIRDGLTHEMLHAIFLYRMIDNPNMPDGLDSEAYVLGLLPAECTDN